MTSLLIICKLQISQNIAMSWTCYTSLCNEAALNDNNDYVFNLFILQPFCEAKRKQYTATVPVLVEPNFFSSTTLGPL